MKNELQPAVQKRLIYAEDLFEPVDLTVFVFGRSSGKTMAMYEQLFRKRVELAPTIDAVPVVRCQDCKHYERGRCEGNHDICTEEEYWFYVKPDDFCSRGERRAEHGKAD